MSVECRPTLWDILWVQFYDLPNARCTQKGKIYVKEYKRSIRNKYFCCIKSIHIPVEETIQNLSFHCNNQTFFYIKSFHINCLRNKRRKKTSQIKSRHVCIDTLHARWIEVSGTMKIVARKSMHAASNKSSFN